jgi:uncharacterized protein (TIGR02246 family)
VLRTARKSSARLGKLWERNVNLASNWQARRNRWRQPVIALVVLAALALAAAFAADNDGTIDGAPPKMTIDYIGGSVRDRAAIRQVSAEWVKHFKSGDVTALMALYEPDAVIMSQGQPRVVGRVAIAKLFTALLQVPDRAIRIGIEEIAVDGRYAWASVLATIRYARSDGMQRQYDSRTFIVYKRGPRGQWRIFRDMDHATPDADPLKAWD